MFLYEINSTTKNLKLIYLRSVAVTFEEIVRRLMELSCVTICEALSNEFFIARCNFTSYLLP